MHHKEEDKIFELLPSYFDETISSEDRVKVKEWREFSDENEQEYSQIKKVWDLTERLNQMEEFDAKAALKKFQANIKKSERSFIQKLQRVAAVLLLPLLTFTALLSYQYFSDKSEDIVWTEYNAIPGIISSFELPDGTQVSLNAESSIKFPSDFGHKKREVKLLGEAYFDVSHNKDVPFLVNTGKVNVRVLGTEFNVSNYTESDYLEIVLASGKIGLYQGEDYNNLNLVTLSPGERGLYTRSNNSLVIDKVEASNFTCWKDGITLFRDTPMQEVVRRLSRRFNVDIELEDIELKEYFFTGTFINEDIYHILDLLKHSTPIEYSINQKQTLKDGSLIKEKIIISKK